MFEDITYFDKIITDSPNVLEAEVFPTPTTGTPNRSDTKTDPIYINEFVAEDFTTERFGDLNGAPSVEKYESTPVSFTGELELENTSFYELTGELHESLTEGTTKPEFSFITTTPVTSFAEELTGELHESLTEGTTNPDFNFIETTPVTSFTEDITESFHERLIEDTKATTPIYSFTEEIVKDFHEGLIEETRTQFNFRTTTPFTEELTEYFHEKLVTETWRDMNATLENSTDFLSNPDISFVNQTLCKWYLPTVHQTPIGLGNIGIALWILGFVITFILMVLFAKQGHFIYKTSHKVYRLHLYFITSVYMVIALLTSIGSGIPRAHAICSGVKDVYMCIGIGHFMDLTIEMYGSEKVMAYYCRDKAVNLRSILICKCFICIPRCKVKKRSITILKWLIWQMKWTQAVYYFFRLIINKSTENTLGVADPQAVQIWYLQILNLLSFITGVAALLLVRTLVVDDLQERYNYNIKAKIVRFTILTTKLQRLIFDILEASNVFPCFPPYVSQNFYKNVLKDFIYLIEVLILGLLTFFVYNKSGEFAHPNSKEVPQPMVQPEEEEEEEGEENGKNVNVDSKLIVALGQKLESMKESNC